MNEIVENKVLQIQKHRPFTLELLSTLLSNHLIMLDDKINEFLLLNPKTPVKDGKVVFDNPASLSILNMTSEIKDLYNQVCKLMTQGLYSNKRWNIKAYTMTRKRYQHFLLVSTERQGVLEINVFQTQHCKMTFSIRLD